MLSPDTSPDAEALVVRRWREMSMAEKARLVEDMSASVNELAIAGIRRRYPDASPRERFLRFAILTLGRSLALRAYPEIAGLRDGS